METGGAKAESIDEYIAAFSPEVRAILEKIRLTIATAAPDAEEAISYRMPTFRQDGVLVHFAAFKNHIGLYPPIRGDAGPERLPLRRGRVPSSGHPRRPEGSMSAAWLPQVGVLEVCHLVAT